MSPSPKKPRANRQAKERQASLAVRLDRAAGILNPFLLVVTIGLLLLNATFFLGMAAAHHTLPAARAATQQNAKSPADTVPMLDGQQTP